MVWILYASLLPSAQPIRDSIVPLWRMPILPGVGAALLPIVTGDFPEPALGNLRGSLDLTGIGSEDKHLASIYWLAAPTSFASYRTAIIAAWPPIAALALRACRIQSSSIGEAQPLTSLATSELAAVRKTFLPRPVHALFGPVLKSRASVLASKAMTAS